MPSSFSLHTQMHPLLPPLQAQASLRSLLSKGIQQRLTACAWPPPLTLSAGSGGAGHTALPGAAKNPFEGPRAAGSVEELQRLLLVLLTLQRAAQHEEFQARGRAAAAQSVPFHTGSFDVPLLFATVSLEHACCAMPGRCVFGEIDIAVSVRLLE